MEEVEPDDEAERFGPVLPPDDRLWRHPSEWAAMAPPPLPRRRLWPAVAASSLAASVVSVTVVVALIGLLRPETIDPEPPPSTQFGVVTGAGSEPPAPGVDAALEEGPLGRAAQPVWFGVAGGSLKATSAKRMGVPGGVLITEVMAGSPALDCEMKSGDLILALDEQPVMTMADLIERLGVHQPGETVRVSFMRDGRPRTTVATLAPPPRPEGTRGDSGQPKATDGDAHPADQPR
ncbi:MAG: S1C family serine protease [Acidimicrobiales bacterium]